MTRARDRLDGIVRHAFEEHCAGNLLPNQVDGVRALVEAHREFGADIEALFPESVRRELGLPD
jgi:hypothetical protein